MRKFAGLIEIIVTARRRNERLLDFVIAVSVLSGEQLAKSGVDSTTGLDIVTPGSRVRYPGRLPQRRQEQEQPVHGAASHRA